MKSEGSRIEAMTVSHGQPAASAMARIADVFPVPGGPQRSTGTRAAMAVASASVAVDWSFTTPSVHDRRSM